MEAGQDDGSFAQIDSALKSAAWVGQIPWFYWAQDWLEPLIGNHLGIRARHGSLRSFAAKEVEQRKERGSDHVDILAKLLQAQKVDPERVDDMAVLSMATSNIFAGSDTTAIAIGAVLYYVCRNTICREKLLGDITSILGNDAPRATVSFELTNRMVYLQACIYEALRLHPAVGMSLPRVVPHGGLHVGSTYIPSGVSSFRVLIENTRLMTLLLDSCLVSIHGSSIETRKSLVKTQICFDLRGGLFTIVDDFGISLNWL